MKEIARKLQEDEIFRENEASANELERHFNSSNRANKISTLQRLNSNENNNSILTEDELLARQLQEEEQRFYYESINQSNLNTSPPAIQQNLIPSSSSLSNIPNKELKVRPNQ